MTSNSQRCPVCGAPAELPSTAACHREAGVRRNVCTQHSAGQAIARRRPAWSFCRGNPQQQAEQANNPAHLNASPIACAPVAQAVATAWLGPCRPCAMLTAPAAMLTRVLGTKKGLSRRTLPSACAASAAEYHTE